MPQYHRIVTVQPAGSQRYTTGRLPHRGGASGRQPWLHANRRFLFSFFFSFRLTPHGHHVLHYKKMWLATFSPSGLIARREPIVWHRESGKSLAC